MNPQDRQRLRALVENTADPFVGQLSLLARGSYAFRRVLYTGPEVQLVTMTLQAGEDIGAETHAKVEQVIDVLAGTAEATIAGKRYPLVAGDTIVIPPGVEHNVANTGKEALRLFTVYSPPNHPPGTVHASKEAAQADTADEAFSKLANQ